MTGTEVDLETQAQRIAARGRDALVERMRAAYSAAAAAHADLISLDDERIESMVQSATDRADGLQWRRALAGVGAEELGVGATEALSHPAVVRAQQLLGAPSYEQSLAEMIARPVPSAPVNGNGSAAAAMAQTEPDAATGAQAQPEPPAPEPPLPDPIPEPPAPEPPEPELSEPELSEPEPSEPELSGPEPSEPEPSEPAMSEPAMSEPELSQTEPPEPEPSDELETVEADDVVLELLPEPDPIEYETEVYDVEAGFAREHVPPVPANPFPAHPAEHGAGEQGDGPAPVPAPEDESDLTLAAVHLGGVANLPTKREGLSVRLSADGLDIMQGKREIIGRLVWDEIEALEVPNLRVRRRSKQLRARLVVRTPHGDASFEVPDVTGDELRELVEPLMALYGRH